MKTTFIIIFTLALLASFKANSQTMSDCSKKAGVFNTYESFNKNIYSDSICLDNKKK